MTSHPVRRFSDILFVPRARRGNVAALRRVANLARRDGASVTVLGIVDEPPRLQRLLHGSDHLNAALIADHHDVERRIDRCVRRLDDADDLEITATVEVGHPVHSIVTRAVAAEHDLIVVTSDRESDDRVTVKRLVRGSPCPIWVMRPSRAQHFRVLAAIDPQPDEVELNASILEVAESVADGGAVHVASAWELFGESTLRSSAFVALDPDELEKQRSAVRSAHEQGVSDVITQFKGDATVFDVHVIPGAAPVVIPDVVRQQRINVVVMGTFGRSGVSGLVMGNTAEQMLDTLSCSIVAVKPPQVELPTDA